ncbi:MAG TPA: aminopeptidase N [Propionibacteriaceae bacterium]|nr:aminopeptidase N [Propionibacteriaceae bacterium]
MFPDNLTRAETRHRARLIETHRYTVEVDLSGRAVADSESEFVSTTTCAFTARSAGETHLDLIAARLQLAVLDGVELDPAGFADSRLPLSLTPGAHELTVQAICQYSRSGVGLHRFVDPLDQCLYLYTQFEPANARRMYACFEQPDLKARFALSVVAPDTWTVVSNAPVAQTAAAGPGLRMTRFAETLPISTYLTALVAGDYQTVPGPPVGIERNIPTAVFYRRSVAAYLDAAEIFAITDGGFEVFERRFGVAYPFGKYDQAFVPEYNGGAMENVGCITLRDEYLFRSKVTAASRDNRRNTILHELSHMWFGDLVTMRWWDDLWLKESFATWSATFAVGEQADDPELSWAAFCSSSKTSAYRQDQLPSTHPVAADIVDLNAVELAFDQIAYAKGAALLGQLVSYVGRDAFLAGVRDYFTAHAFGNTALTDLLESLERSSGRDLSRWSAQWLETAGVNTLRLELTTDGQGLITSAVVTQTAPDRWPTLREHRIALGLYADTDEQLVRIGRIETEVAGPDTPVPDLVGVPRPDAIVVNDDDLSYTKVRLDHQSFALVVTRLPTITSPLTRAVLWGALWDTCRDAELPAAAYVDLVLRGVPAEADATAVRNLLGQAGMAAYSYAAPRRRDEIAEMWQHGLGRLLAEAPAGSDLQLALARAFATAANPGWAADRLHRWWGGEDVPDGLVVDTDLRWLLVANLSRLGRLDEAAIAAEERRDPSITGAEQAAGARAAQPTAAAKAMAWGLAVEADGIPNTIHTAICLRFWLRGQDHLLLPYVEPYLAVAEDISALRGVWADRAAVLRKNVLRLLFPWPTDKRALLDRLDPWLASAELSDSVRRIIEERRDDLVRALRCQSVDA